MITIVLSDDATESTVLYNGEPTRLLPSAELPADLVLAGTVQLYSRTDRGVIAYACYPCGFHRICCSQISNASAP